MLSVGRVVVLSKFVAIFGTNLHEVDALKPDGVRVHEREQRVGRIHTLGLLKLVH